MANQPQMPESLEELPFPMHGLNLIVEFEAQPQGTTPVGTNVRAYETLTQRNRGGSRPGLARYIDSQVLGFPSKIQHLNIIVDPTEAALIGAFDDPGDTIEDPSTNNLRIRNPVPHRRVRRGGSARQPNSNKPPLKHPSITKVTPNVGNPDGGDTVTITGKNLQPTPDAIGQTVFNFGPGNAATLTFLTPTSATVVTPSGTGTVDVQVTVPTDLAGNGGTSPITSADKFTYGGLARVQAITGGIFSFPVVQGNLIIVLVSTVNGSGGVGLSDSQGNSYTLAAASPTETGVSGTTYSAALYYTIASASGPLTIGITGTGASINWSIEYTKGTPFVTPFDNAASAGAAPNTASTTAAVTVPVNGATPEVVITFFTGDYLFNGQVSPFFDFLPVSADQNVSVSGTGANPFLGAAWVAVGASFKQA